MRRQRGKAATAASTVPWTENISIRPLI